MHLRFPPIYQESPQEPDLLCRVHHPHTLKLHSLHVPRPLGEALERAGVHPGARLRVRANDGKGTLAVECGGRLLILGRGISYHLRVARLPVARVIPFPGR